MTERLRVAHLDHTRAVGGAELALRRTLLAGPTWDATVLLPERGPGEADDGAFEPLHAAGVSVTSAGPAQEAGLGEGTGLTRALAGLRSVRSVARALRSEPSFARADVVHTNTSRAALYGALAVDRSRQSLVVHLRDFVTPDAIGRFGALAMHRYVLPRASAVVANSEATLATASSSLRPGTPTLVLQSPIGVSRAADPRPAGDELVVGMVARLAPWKGQRLLVEAFAQAFPENAARLRLIGASQFGEESYADEVRALAARLDVADRVELTGHVEDVTAAIQGLDVCVQASVRPEPLGQNVLQYLALGRPTVVADAGGPTEWVTDDVNGLVFRSGDAGSLARALGRLGDDASLRARLATAAASTPGIAPDEEVAARLGDLFATVARRG